MSSLEVVLAAINMVQVVALAWIASRQQQVKGELRRTNGEMSHAIAELRREIVGTRV